MHETTEFSLYDGIAAAHGGDYERAGRLLTEVLAEHPDHEEAWFWFALSADSPAEAIPRLRKVVDLAPERDDARDALGRLLPAHALTQIAVDASAALPLLDEASAI